MDNSIDESIRESLAGFDTLWQRVTGSKQPGSPPEEETPAPRFQAEQALQGFIQAELCAAAFDSALARMLQGGSRAVLLAQAGDAKHRAGRLRAEYFISTGVSYTPGNNFQSVTGKLASLRAAMLREERLAQDYTLAAQAAPPALQAIFADYAAGSAAHAQALRGILVDCFA